MNATPANIDRAARRCARTSVRGPQSRPRRRGQNWRTRQSRRGARTSSSTLLLLPFLAHEAFELVEQALVAAADFIHEERKDRLRIAAVEERLDRAREQPGLELLPRVDGAVQKCASVL